MKSEINRRNDTVQGPRLIAPDAHRVTAEIKRDTMGGTWVTLSQYNYQGKQEMTLTGWQFVQVAAKVASRMAEFKREDAERAAWDALPEDERQRITENVFAEIQKALEEPTHSPAEAPQSPPMAPDGTSAHPDTMASS